MGQWGNESRVSRYSPLQHTAQIGPVREAPLKNTQLYLGIARMGGRGSKCLLGWPGAWGITVKTVIWHICSSWPENKCSFEWRWGQSLFWQCPNRGCNFFNGAPLARALLHCTYPDAVAPLCTCYTALVAIECSMLQSLACHTCIAVNKVCGHLLLQPTCLCRAEN